MRGERRNRPPTFTCRAPAGRARVVVLSAGKAYISIPSFSHELRNAYTMTGDPMNPMKDVTLCLLGLSLAGSIPGFSQERDRSKVPDQYKWNLTDIYPSDAAWKSAKEKLLARIPSIGSYRG